MPAPDEVKRLVDTFHASEKKYTAPEYNETEARNELIDPFFSSLGWDVGNRQGVPPDLRDVIYEQTFKRNAGLKQPEEIIGKRPDYTFRIEQKPRFYVEAKKPAVDLANDPKPAYQVRAYGWSTRLPISVLTDFQELSVYDCRVQPKVDDSPATARIPNLYIRYNQYVDRWEEIAALLSRDAVLSGSLDRYAETPPPRGAQTVDKAFLDEISGWRHRLASDLAKRNPGLSERDLNYAVQMTINRIIFLRICEDRGIEPYERLMSVTVKPSEATYREGYAYRELAKLFQSADERYNSGLFHFRQADRLNEQADTFTLKMEVGDKALGEIIKHLYYPYPYKFDVMPIEILGQVYEQFLGEVIVLKENRSVKVEQKPEVRKAGGVYYTPTYIVDYIVEHTVGKLVEGKTPEEVSKLRVLDPACGSGSFLIGAYDFLLKWHLNYYTTHEPERFERTNRRKGGTIEKTPKGDGWRLSLQERKRILRDNIYGVDIDTQAVEVTKLSLLLKVLEGSPSEQRQLTLDLEPHERVLPDLGDNIKCGNSLIGPDFYESVQGSYLDDEEEIQRINVFDWKAAFPQIMGVGGFDAVIGNPPYDVMEKERGESSWPHSALSVYARARQDLQYALGGKLNLFRFFAVQSVGLVRVGGLFGMIMPMSLLADISTAQTRRYIILSSGQVFADCFPQKDNANRRVFHGAKLSTAIVISQKNIGVDEDSAQIRVHVYPWNRFEDHHTTCTLRYGDAKLLDPVNVPIPLVDQPAWDLCRRIHTLPQVVRLGDETSFEVTRGEINQTVYRRYITTDSAKSRLIKGAELGRFEVRPNLSQGQREWFDEGKFLKKEAPKSVVQRNRIATQRITGVDEYWRIVATLIDAPAYFADSTNSVVMRVDSPYRIAYLLGLLNSRLFQWRFKITSSNNNVATNQLDALPLRTINFDDPTDKVRHDRMVQLVERMLDLHKRLQSANMPHDKASIEARIKQTDREIDRLVYELYGLTDEEIGIVEGGQAKGGR